MEFKRGDWIIYAFGDDKCRVGQIFESTPNIISMRYVSIFDIPFSVGIDDLVRRIIDDSEPSDCASLWTYNNKDLIDPRLF